MDSEELKQLESASLSPESGAFFRRLFDGLMKQGWGWQGLKLDAGQQALLQNLLQRWIAQAPAGGDDDAMRLMVARNGLRRLAFAMGVSLDEIVCRALDVTGADNLMTLPPASRRKLAFLADAQLCQRFDIVEWSRAEPRLAMLYAVTAMDDVPLPAARQAALDRLAALIPSLPLADLPSSALTLLYRACYRLSYITSARRYDAKAHLVRQAGLVLKTSVGRALPLVGAAQTGADKARPHLLVIGEGLQPGHAMFRFYATTLREMRRDFQITLMTDVAPVPAQPAVTPVEMAERVVHFAASEDPVSAWVKQIAALQPDIIFYPSIGMSFATFTLSLLRLAPLQVASTGHPASSCSPVIDATLLFDELSAPPGLPLPLRYNDHRLFPAVAGLEMPVRLGAVNHDLPCIGINAVISKLNAGFLDVVEQLLRRFGKPCRLRFLPNAGALEWQGLARLLVQRFPEVEVVPSLDHKSYLAELAQCDLILQSFPFGGANTTNDALKLGIPVVALRDAVWLSGQTDAVMLNARGLGHLCVSTIEDYLDLALRLLNEQDFAETLRAGLREAGPGAGQARKGEVTASDALLRHWKSVSEVRPA